VEDGPKEKQAKAEGAAASRTVVDDQMAGAALRKRAAFLTRRNGILRSAGLVETPAAPDMGRVFARLPQVESTSDFHCVTRWSRLDNRWKGVRFTDVVERAKAKTGSRIRASARRGGIYVEYPAEGFVAAGCPVRFRT